MASLSIGNHLHLLLFSGRLLVSRYVWHWNLCSNMCTYFQNICNLICVGKSWFICFWTCSKILHLNNRVFETGPNFIIVGNLLILEFQVFLSRNLIRGTDIYSPKQNNWTYILNEQIFYWKRHPMSKVIHSIFSSLDKNFSYFSN